jgi:hydrogenase/urease accessory protein HupE
MMVMHVLTLQPPQLVPPILVSVILLGLIVTRVQPDTAALPM